MRDATSNYSSIPIPQTLPRSGSSLKAWTINPARKKTLHPAMLSSSLVRNAPILFFQVYLTGSIFAFAFGPVTYDISNPLILYPYVLIGQLAIALGYKAGMATPPRRYTGRLSPRLLLLSTIVITSVLLPITLHYRNYGNLGLAEALADPNAAYMARLKSFDYDSNAPWLSVMRGLLSPLLALFMPMGIIYWKLLQPAWRALWIAGIGGAVVLALFSGAAVGLFDIVLVVPWMAWLAIHHRSASNGGVASRLRAENRGNVMLRRMLLAGVTIAVLIGGLKWFSHSRQARYQLSGDQYPMWTTCWSYDLYGVRLSESTEYMIYCVCGYWSHGYEGLSECLELPFEWTKGVGHSRFWTRYLGPLIGDADAIDAASYPMRLQSSAGYDAYSVWHTAYPWLASDLTFTGAILFMGCMGYLLAMAWSDAVCKTNPYAFGFLSQLLIFFYYIPANAGRLSYPEETLAFWGTLFLWLVTRETRRSASLAIQKGMFCGHC